MSYTVYYLDDEPELRNTLRRYFARRGVALIPFADASEAIDTCLHSPPDVFLIDYRLANTTGVQVAEAVDDAIKKILVTGELSFEDDPLFDAVVQKPFRLRHIFETVEGLCSPPT